MKDIRLVAPFRWLHYHAGLRRDYFVAIFTAACLCNVGRCDEDTEQCAIERDDVWSAMEANRSRLDTCHLIWHRETNEVKGADGKILTTSGVYELWKKSGKLATKFIDDTVCEVAPGAWQVKKFGRRTVLDGHDFLTLEWDDADVLSISHTAKYRPHENWFDIIGWNQPSYLQWFEEGGLDNVEIMSCRVKEYDMSQVFHLEIRSLSDNSEKIVWYSIDKGCCLLREEWKDGEQRTTMVDERELTEVQKNVWMPTVVRKRRFDPSTGRVQLDQTFTIDMNQSSFGGQSTIEGNVFSITITPKTGIFDSRKQVKNE